MNKVMFSMSIILAALLIVAPLASAQERGGPPRGSGDSGRGMPAPSSSVSTASAPYSVSSPGSSPVVGIDRGMASRPYPTIATVHGTSFYTSNWYYVWNDYYSYLNSYYGIYPSYFGRFMRNREPLMTPVLLRITLREPLRESEEMLAAIDQLESLLSDVRAGKSVDKSALISKSREIRAYAKRIRQDRTLSLIDLRAQTDLSSDNTNALDPETIARLRELALDLNRQLRQMYSLSSSSTISVDSYKEFSFESMTKGIEQVCKAIEHSSKRL